MKKLKRFKIKRERERKKAPKFLNSIKIFSHRVSFNMNTSKILPSNSSRSDDHGGGFFAWYDSLYTNADPRIRDKFLMGKPHWLILSYVVYVLVVTWFLPRFMRHRKPYDFQKMSLYIDGILLSISFFFCIIGAFAWTILGKKKELNSMWIKFLI